MSAVVIDFGSATVKSGLASDSQPKCNPAEVSLNRRLSSNAIDHPDLSLGNSARRSRCFSEVRFPVQRAEVVDWDHFERLLSHAFDLCGVHGELESAEHPLVLTGPLWQQKNDQVHLCQVLFESLQVPCARVASASLLALYGTGAHDGLLLDIGHGLTRLLPVRDGRPVPGAGERRLALAGVDLDERLAALVSPLAPGGRLSLHTVREVKEELAAVARTPQEFESGARRFSLADGDVLAVGAERFEAAEALFEPRRARAGLGDGLAAEVAAVRAAGAEGLPVVITGGTAALPGLCERLRAELELRGEAAVRPEVAERPAEAAWRGGRAVATWRAEHGVKEGWIELAEYQEEGAEAVFERLG